jgi:hypothetical protein
MVLADVLIVYTCRINKGISAKARTIASNLACNELIKRIWDLSRLLASTFTINDLPFKCYLKLNTNNKLQKDTSSKKSISENVIRESKGKIKNSLISRINI